MRSWPQKNSSRKQKIGRPQIGSRWASAMLASRSSWPWRSAERPPIHDGDVSRGHPADVHALARRQVHGRLGGQQAERLLEAQQSFSSSMSSLGQVPGMAAFV